MTVYDLNKACVGAYKVIFEKICEFFVLICLVIRPIYSQFPIQASFVSAEILIMNLTL